ncbi:UDP-N-acetylglucosamine transporter [Entamoeba marina]
MNNISLTTIFVLALSFQSVALLLAIYYSRGYLRESYSISVVILLSEILKLFMSLVGVFFTLKPDTNIVSHIKNVVIHSFITITPAIIYFCQNISIQIALAYIPTELYVIMSQLEIVWIALFSYFMIKMSITLTQWRAIVAICLCVLAIETATRYNENITFANCGGYVLGVAAAILATLASGFSNIYMDSILKTKLVEGPKYNLWDRNIQISMYSIVFSIITAILFDSKNILDRGPLFDFSIFALGVVILLAIGGILTSVALVHADNIVKEISPSITILLTLFCMWILFGKNFGFEFGVGVIGLIVSIFNYKDYKASSHYQKPETLEDQLPNEMKNDVVQLDADASPTEIETKTLFYKTEELDSVTTEGMVIIDDLEN